MATAHVGAEVQPVRFNRLLGEKGQVQAEHTVGLHSASPHTDCTRLARGACHGGPTSEGVSPSPHRRQLRAARLEMGGGVDSLSSPPAGWRASPQHVPHAQHPLSPLMHAGCRQSSVGRGLVPGLRLGGAPTTPKAPAA